MPQLTFDLFFDQFILAICFYIILYYLLFMVAIPLVLHFIVITQNNGLRLFFKSFFSYAVFFCHTLVFKNYLVNFNVYIYGKK